MALRRLVAVAVVAWVAFGVAAGPRVVAAAPNNPFPSASDTYYRLDVPNGTMSVRVELTILNGSGRDAAALPIYALPKASNVVVQRDGVTLPTTIGVAALPGNTAAEKVLAVTATLQSPVRPNTKTGLVMTYDVPAQKGDFLRLEPGAIETAFIGQGPGSFVHVDVPLNAENYFDPGCLKTTDQPAEVKKAGFERWVCGDVAVIALNTNHPEVLKRCADLDDKCRQRESDSTFSAFVQSITDQSLRGRLEADVAMKDGSKKLVFGFFRRDQAWADREFALAQQVLPTLEAAFGFAYPNGETIFMRQSHHIEQIGAAGVAFPDQGQVLITPNTGFDEEVTIHELAHQWAGSNLTDGWLWEGLAEYAMKVVAPQVGVRFIDRKWQSLGYKDPLMTWHNGSLVGNPNYWYGKAGAFWFAYEAAIGGRENMVKVLSQTSPTNKRSPYDGRWFMDAGERVSGANLDSLFMEWVFNPATAGQLVKDRRATYDALNATLARALEMGLSGTPTDIYGNLDVWNFAAVESQLGQAKTLLDTYAVVQQQTAEAGLPPSHGVADSWGTQPLAVTAGKLEEQRQALRAILESMHEVATDGPDSPQQKQLALAIDRFAAGDFAEAKRLATSIATNAYNAQAAERMIKLALREQAGFSSGFLSRVGLFRRDPDGDLAAAQQALAAGDGTTALKKSTSAYYGWKDANGRGLQRLAILMGFMCALSVGVWLWLRRIDKAAQKVAASARAGRPGHFIDASEASSRWKDWENIK